jgi:cholest-4-en-3-one 26-monooxygenase
MSMGAVATRLDDIDLSSPDTFVAGWPHEAFALLRREAPVYWHPGGGAAGGFWVVSKYNDVMAVQLDAKTFSSARGGTILREFKGDELEANRAIMLNMDAPRHTRFRRLVNMGFSPKIVNAMTIHIREIASRIVDAVAARGRCDFVADIAAELPLQVIVEMMGVPVEDRHLVFKWSNQMIGFDDPEYQTSADVSSAENSKLASMEMFMYANKLVEERKQNPRHENDLVSVLLAAEVDGEKLTEVEFDSFFLLLAVAGNETTRNLVSGGMLALVQHPEERARLLRDPSLLPKAVEEMLRWVSPVMYFRRTATRDTELHGQAIREGDKVTVWYGSANRDEDIFPDAHRFDVGRTPNDHVAFGLGHHFCLGANLARLEIQIMFEELLRRMPDIELDGPVERLRSNFINGIKRMPIRYTPERS